jgi:alpha-tubulin suppressor-like RCC1 family protein
MALTFSGVTFSGGYQIDPTFVPDAPTIGVATATGATTATVAFTAPSYGGSTTITTYTATSSPGGITGTLSQAGSGTITVTGLTASTSYTFTVTATNTNGTSVPSAASNSITTQSSGTPPVNTVAPVVSGTATYDYPLSCTTGTWTGTATITYTYQWQRSSGTYSNILGANSSTYTLVADDVNKTIRCVVTGTNSTGSSSANSNATGDVSPVAPTSPTSVTASIAGATSASVSFTGSSNNGGWPISSYTATSSPGGITGTINQPGSGTITVTGLTTGTGYTFTVTATNGYYTSSPSSPSNSVTPAIVNRLYTWGLNRGFKLGLGDTNPRSNPTQVGIATNWGSLTTIDGYTNSYGFGIQTDGSLWSWGIGDYYVNGVDFFGQFGSSSPFQVGYDTDWSSITSKNFGVFAIRTNGTLWTWGNNYNPPGQLGLNTVGAYGGANGVSSPVQIGAGTNWSAVSIGAVGFVIAAKTDGTMWSWGENNYGELGINETGGFRSSPVQIGSGTTWSKVATNQATGYAIKTDGTLWSWGSNNFGQLGLSRSTSSNISSPAQIGTDTNWASIFGDGNAVTAIKTNGTIWSWGQNYGGVLGQNNSVYRSSPVQIGSLTTWSKVSMLDQGVFAIKTNGSLWTWGYNANGELGQGNTISRSSPVQVGVSTNWSNVGPGGAIG